MAADVTLPGDRRVAVGDINLHVRIWTGPGRPWVLLHGLASNALTWEATARHLNAAGHMVVTVDQRGHGRSDKPATGYGFDPVVEDLHGLLGALGLERPLIAGQSWGGNVVLAFGARHPGIAAGLALVDGGFIDLAADPSDTWEVVSARLRPPALAGMPLVDLRQRMRAGHPDWSDEGIEHQLANFEALPDGRIRPWLTLTRHMEILRALWEQRPGDLYPMVGDPVLVAVAEGRDPGRVERKRREVAALTAGLPRARVHRFVDTDHDIHVQRPRELADLFLRTSEEGFFPG